MKKCSMLHYYLVAICVVDICKPEHINLVQKGAILLLMQNKKKASITLYCPFVNIGTFLASTFKWV